MKQETIYILHKNGAPSHYYALAYLAKENGLKVKYREFSILSKFYKGIVKGKPALSIKQFTNAWFLWSLLFSKDKKVVFGIAPFDPKLGGLLRFLKKHRIYYHTSWTHWDKSFHPKQKKNTPKVFQDWKEFLEIHCTHVFTVTEKSKTEICSNYNISEEKISIVHHSLHPQYLEYKSESRIPLSFLYMGRMTPEKGIKELLDFFSKHPSATLTLIGDGKEEALIKDYSERYENIIFKGYISEKKTLIHAFRSHQFLVLNSKRTTRWEELFGLIIIEAMSQGTLPISSAHSGPKEIIGESFGYLFEEGEITSTLATIIKDIPFQDEMRKEAIRQSKFYTVKEISKRWQPILD